MMILVSIILLLRIIDRDSKKNNTRVLNKGESKGIDLDSINVASSIFATMAIWKKLEEFYNMVK